MISPFSYFEQFLTFRKTDAEIFITTQQFIEIIPQHLFQSSQESKIKQI